MSDYDRTSNQLLYALTDMDVKWMEEAEKAYRTGKLPARDKISMKSGTPVQKKIPAQGKIPMRNGISVQNKVLLQGDESVSGKHAVQRKFVKYLAVAACAALIGGAGWIASQYIFPSEGDPGKQGNWFPSEGDSSAQGNWLASEGDSGEQGNWFPSEGDPGVSKDWLTPRKDMDGENPTKETLEKEERDFVDISTLLASGKAEMPEEQVSIIGQVNIGNYTALYEKVPAVSGNALMESAGEALEENEGWYKVSGHEEAQFLIRASKEEEEEYTLWEFSYFLSEKYPYRDVMEGIYGLKSADDIRSISAVAAKRDGTDEGRKLQEEIGEQTITDRAQIQQFYDILCGMTCYGSSKWELVDDGAAGLDISDKDAMLNTVRLGRYLTMELANGNSVDALKYTAAGGMFYEFGGVAYRRLTAEEKAVIDEMFHIEIYENTDTTGQGGLGKDETGKGKTNSAAGDVPVDEGTYQEAHRYADEVEEVQYAISQAMMAKELPFVIKSAIYENPVRVEVTLTTTDEEAVEKVKAFDPSGKIIKIVYSEGRAVLE